MKKAASQSLNGLDKALARGCQLCPVCNQARRRQAGWAFWLVKRVERRACPFCRAYESVLGFPAHAALPKPEHHDGSGKNL